MRACILTRRLCTSDGACGRTGIAAATEMDCSVRHLEDHVSVLIKVTDIKKEDVYINPEQIVWIKQHQGGGTEIRFTNEHATLMLGKKPEELEAILRNCGK